MFKVGLTALVAIPLTFASAQAFDNSGAARAAAAFGQFGLQGLAVAGRARADVGFPPLGPYEEAPVGAPTYTSVGPPAYTPVWWTRYATVANGNTLMNVPISMHLARTTGMTSESSAPQFRLPRRLSFASGSPSSSMAAIHRSASPDDQVISREHRRARLADRRR